MNTSIKVMAPALLALALVTSNHPAQAANAVEMEFDPEELFSEAMAKRASGSVYRAIELFETLLANKPGLNRARLELAVAYHQARRYKNARDEFKDVLNDPSTPQTVKLSIMAYLAQLKSDEDRPRATHSYTSYLEAGLLYDSNVNVGPDSNLIEAGGSPFTLTNANKISSAGISALASIAHRYEFTSLVNIDDMAAHFEWQSQAAISNKAHFKSSASNFDLGTISISSGPVLYAPAHWRAVINVKLDQIYQDGDDLALFSSLNPVVNFDLDPTTNLALEVSLFNRDYSSVIDTSRDNHGITIGAGISSLIDSRLAGFESGIRHHSNTARDASFSNDGLEVYLGGFMTTSADATAYARASARAFEYKAPDLTFGVVRDDDEWQISTGISYSPLEGFLQGWTLKADASHTRNGSTIDAYDYERTQLNANASQTF